MGVGFSDPINALPTPCSQVMVLALNLLPHTLSLVNVTGLYWTTLPSFPAFTPVDYYLEGDGTLSHIASTVRWNEAGALRHRVARPVSLSGSLRLTLGQ